MADLTIADWNAADETLARLGELRRIVAALELERDQAIETLKARCATAAREAQEEIADREPALKRFVDEHQEEMGARSKKLEHGTVAYRWVTKLSISSRRVKGAVEWLLRARKLEYLHVEHKLNKEALREATPAVLKAIGARVQEVDQFRYEIGDVSYVVEG